MLINRGLTFTPAEIKCLMELVSEVLTIVNYDDTGVTDDLIDPAMTAAEILGMTAEGVEDDSEPD